jgi:hypothetical protein
MGKTLAEEMAIVDAARAKTLKALERAKITHGRVASKISKGMNEKDPRHYLKATEIAIALLDMKPTEKHDLTVHGEIKALLQEIDGSTTGPPGQRGKKP